MHPIVKTEGVVLRSTKYRETSKIVTVYTRGFGKVKAIAKGARQSKNTYGSSLEPMSYVFLVLYKKEHRDIQLISQCDVIQSFRHLSENLDKMAAGMSMIELVEKVSHDEEANEKLFGLLTGALSAVNTAALKPWNLLYGFEIRLAGILGFQPDFEKCVSCGRFVEKGFGNSIFFFIGKGGPMCPSHADSMGMKVNVSVQSLRILGRLAAAGTFEEMTSIEVDEAHRREIESVLMGFLRFHVEGLHTLKAGKVLSRILT